MRNKGQSGQTLVMFAVVIFTLLGLTALTIDVSRLLYNAREAQVAADAAAIGGTLRLIEHGNAAEAVAGAQQSADFNQVNGQTATIAASNIAAGHWSCTPPGACTGNFVAGATPYNAVQTTPNYAVTNIFGLWAAVSHPQRTATAAFLTLGTGIPGVPIMLANCFSCYTKDCTPPPEIITFGSVPTNDGAFFYSTATQGKPGIESYIPASACCSSRCGKTAPTLYDGEAVTANNGTISAICGDFTCLIGKQYLVPVVGASCGAPYNGSNTVTGFATITILGTRCSPGGATGDAPPSTYTNALKVQAHFIDCAKPENAPICSSQLTSECPGCGTGKVVMVE